MATITKRHYSRRLALQGLYQWHMTDNDLSRIEAYLLTLSELKKDIKAADVSYFKDLLHNIPAKITELDDTIAPKLDRPINKLSIIELMLLRMGTYELLVNKVPKKVVINEMVELAKTFGGEDGYKYINGILDKIL